MEDIKGGGGGLQSVESVWKLVLGSVLESQPQNPLEHIHTFLGELTDPTLSHNSHNDTKITSAVDTVISIEYSEIFTELFNDHVYTVYTHLTDDTRESLLAGIPCQIYEDFISHYISVIDELLKEPVKIILYSHHEPCVSYSSLKKALTGVISIKEYYRLAKELYHSITMTTNLAQVIMDQLAEMTPWKQLQLNWENIIEEKEFLKTTLELFYQQYTQYEEY